MPNSEEEQNNNEEKKDVSEEFIEMVKAWVKIDDEIRKKQYEIKELKNERKEYEEFVLDYMESIDEKVISITGGKLRRNKSQTKTGLKPQHIQNVIYEMTKDSAQAIKMTKMIMDSRPTVERVNLKRTTDKKKKD